MIAVILDEINKIKILDNYRYHDEILFEFRFDKLPTLINSITDMDFPKNRSIFTLRSAEEGGAFDGTNRDEILFELAKLKPKYLDLELKQDFHLIEQLKNRVENIIISVHDYNQPAFEALAKYSSELSNFLPEDNIVMKLVGKPADSYDMLKTLTYLCKKFPRHIILGIGNNGIISRTMGEYFNQEFVFGSLHGGSIPRFTNILKLKTDNPVFVGLLGQSLDHSLSPIIHEIFFELTEILGYYHTFELSDGNNLEEFIQLLDKTPITGLNVTFPYKNDIVRLCEYKDEIVTKLSSANTLVFSNEGIKAFNTDVIGFEKLFEAVENSDQINKILVFGAGGASISVCTFLLQFGYNITIVNRSKNRLLDLPEYIKKNTTQILLSQINDTSEFDVYINATSIGYNSNSPSDYLPLSPSLKIVVDLNYGVNGTKLTREAKKLGIDSYDGKKMLFYQALESFKLWTESEIDEKVAYNMFLEVLNENN